MADTDRCIPLCHVLDTPSKQQVRRPKLIKNSKKLNTCLNFCYLVFETVSHSIQLKMISDPTSSTSYILGLQAHVTRPGVCR